MNSRYQIYRKISKSDLIFIKSYFYVLPTYVSCSQNIIKKQYLPKNNFTYLNLFYYTFVKP